MSKVRITGGEWRSRLIQVADAPGLRPTPDRVRETLFNWLGQDLSGLVCLDLFAGSGILGFDAASRGAERVTLVERDPRVFARLRQNAEALGESPSPLAGEGLGRGVLEVSRADALEFVALAARQERRYDLIFLDPPYRQGWLDRLWPLLPPVMAVDARLYAEAEGPVESPAPWRTLRRGKAGQVHYHLFGLNR